MAKKRQLNLGLITKAITGTLVVLILACIGLTTKYAWTSLTGSTPSGESPLGTQFKAEGIDMELIERVSNFRSNRQTRPSTLSGETRDPFHLPPAPPPPAPVEVQPPATEQPAAVPDEQPAP